MLEFFLLLTAGLLGGVVNTVAGGGSFITFPALLAVGVPPVAANATNTFASFAGYASGAVDPKPAHPLLTSRGVGHIQFHLLLCFAGTILRLDQCSCKHRNCASSCAWQSKLLPCLQQRETGTRCDRLTQWAPWFVKKSPVLR